MFMRGISALAVERPNVIRRPQTISLWDGLPLDMEFRGKHFTAFVSIEILEALGTTGPNSQPTHQEYLAIFDNHREAVINGIRVAFERGVWSRGHQHLRVRSIDVRELVPPDAWDQLVIADPEIMRGSPVFAGTRVPIKFVLSALAAGSSLEKVRSDYPFVTEAHVEAARKYAQEHPPSTTHTTQSSVPSSWKLKSREVRPRPRATCALPGRHR